MEIQISFLLVILVAGYCSATNLPPSCSTVTSYYMDATPVGCISPNSTSPEEFFALRLLFNVTLGQYWTQNNFWSNATASPCQYFGVFCDSNCRIQSLILPHNNLQGIIPPSVFSGLPHLIQLDLSCNPLSRILETVAQYASSTLQAINFNGCLLDEVLPQDWSRMRELSVLSAEHNFLKGELPSNITAKQISLSFNNLNGSLEKLTSVPEYLYVADNYFKGSIPVKWFTEANLVVLDLSNNIMLDSPFPSFTIPLLGQYSSPLIKLFARNCSLSGTIPSNSISALRSLTELDFSFNNLEGTLPNSVVDHRVLQVANFNFNRLTGEIDRDLNSATLINLFLRGNHLAKFPNSIGSLSILDVRDNPGLEWNGVPDQPQSGSQFYEGGYWCSSVSVNNGKTQLLLDPVVLNYSHCSCDGPNYEGTAPNCVISSNCAPGNLSFIIWLIIIFVSSLAAVLTLLLGLALFILRNKERTTSIPPARERLLQ